MTNSNNPWKPKDKPSYKEKEKVAAASNVSGTSSNEGNKNIWGGSKANESTKKNNQENPSNFTSFAGMKTTAAPTKDAASIKTGGGGNFIDNLIQAIQNIGGGDKNNLLKNILIALLLLWLASGIYRVNPEENAVVVRFGEYVNTTGPGLHYHLPLPIESIQKVAVTRIRKLEMGSNTDNPSESIMLTGDENMIDISFQVQWKIKNARDYVFNIKDPEENIRVVTESVLREVIGNNKINFALAEGRSVIEVKVKKILQNILDSYHTGIEIVTVQMLRSDPPLQVIDAFRDVQNARADREKQINQAYAYRNDIIPRAEGESQKILQDANAYSIEVTSAAEGQVERLKKIYGQYTISRDVAKKRMYLETMEQIVKNIDTVIVDSAVKGNVIIPLSKDQYTTIPSSDNRQ